MNPCSAIGLVVLATSVAFTSATLPAFPALTFSLGSPSLFVANSAQVALAAAALAGIVIAKSALKLALIYDSNRGAISQALQQRSKREAVELDFSPMFESIDKQDVADCAKLLVCHSFAANETERTSEEKAIVNFFDDLTTIQQNSFGKYQWAAYTGTFKNPEICTQRYNKCPLEVGALADMIEVDE